MTNQPHSVDLLAAISEAVAGAMDLGCEDSPSLMLVNSWEMDSTRRTVLCFRPGADTPSFIAKVGWNAGLAKLQGERDNLERLRDADLSHDCPASLRIAEWAYEQVEKASGQVWVNDAVFQHLGAA